MGRGRAAFQYRALIEEGGVAGGRFNTGHLMKREEWQGGVSIPGT